MAVWCIEEFADKLIELNRTKPIYVVPSLPPKRGNIRHTDLKSTNDIKIIGQEKKWNWSQEVDNSSITFLRAKVWTINLGFYFLVNMLWCLLVEG